MLKAKARDLLYAFDGMQQFMKEHVVNDPDYPDVVNRSFLYELVDCFNEIDPNLLESVNAQWKGFKKYATWNDSDWKHCHLNGTGYVR